MNHFYLHKLAKTVRKVIKRLRYIYHITMIMAAIVIFQKKKWIIQ